MEETTENVTVNTGIGINERNLIMGSVQALTVAAVQQTMHLTKSAVQETWMMTSC